MLPDDRDAERATELARRVVDRRADVGPRRRERAHDRLGRRRAGEAHARPHQHEREREAAVAGVRADRRRDGEPGREQQHPERRDPLRPEALDELGRGRREDDHRARVGQHAHAGRGGREAEDELQVLGGHEQEPEEREEEHHHGGARGAEARVAEQPDVEQRLGGAPLLEHERGQQQHGDAAGGEHGRATSSPRPAPRSPPTRARSVRRRTAPRRSSRAVARAGRATRARRGARARSPARTAGR